MATIRRRGGLFVATAAICVVLMSATTTAVHAEPNPSSVAKHLRGGRRSLIASEKNTYYAQSILNGRRRAEGGGGGEGGEGQGGEGQGGEGQGGEGQANGEGNEQNNEKQQEQEQQYQEGNNDNQQEQQQEQENQQEQQQEEEKEDKNEENEEGDMNDEAEADANDDQSSFVADTQEKMSSLMDRFDEDVASIWSTSPSEWNDELWKVFGAVAGAFTLILSCVFYLFCMCCSGDRGDIQYDIDTKEGADNRKRKKNHRGRLFNRMRTNDADTVASGQTRGTEADDKAFVLIEDVDDKSRMGPSSVYANGDAQPDAISPMSSKTGRLEHKYVDRPPRDLDAETQYTKSSYKTRDTQYTRGADTQYTRGMTTYKSSRSGKKGIFNETVDVWSEFLGFKKVKSYNTAAFIKKRAADEDDYINETDDEKSRRAMRTSKGQMKTGTYVAPPEADVEVNLSNTSGTSHDAKNERLAAPTPVMSNVISQAGQPSSPRRTALVKTRNLLKSIGKSKTNKQIGNSTSVDSKEKALSTKGSKTLSTKGSKTLSSKGSKGLSSNGSDHVNEGDEIASL